MRITTTKENNLQQRSNNLRQIFLIVQATSAYLILIKPQLQIKIDWEGKVEVQKKNVSGFVSSVWLNAWLNEKSAKEYRMDLKHLQQSPEQPYVFLSFSLHI